MIVRIQKRDNPFVQIDKRPLEDERLSWKAKGLLAHLLCKPDNWEISVADLVSRSRDGREAVQSALRELKQLGYATLESKRGEGGRLLGKTWVIYELPTDGKPVFRLATDERKNRPTEKPSNGKSAPSNNILEERIKEEGERDEPAPAQIPVSLIDRAEQIKKDRPGLRDIEYKLLAVVDQVRDYLIQYPATIEVLTGGLIHKARLLKKDSEGKNQFGAEVDKWIRHNGLNSVIVSNATDYITTGSHSLAAWLRIWDKLEGQDKAKDKPAYVAPGNVF